MVPTTILTTMVPPTTTMDREAAPTPLLRETPPASKEDAVVAEFQDMYCWHRATDSKTCTQVFSMNFWKCTKEESITIYF